MPSWYGARWRAGRAWWFSGPEAFEIMSPSSRMRSSAAPVEASLGDDPVVAAQVARALAPYRDALSPAEAAAVEDALWMMLTTHPVVAPWVDALRRDAQVEQSGPRAKETPSEEGGRLRRGLEPGSRARGKRR